MKRAVLIWHRRTGKDKTCLNFTVQKTQERVGSYYYFLPTYTQGKKVIWDGMDRDGFRFMDHFPKDLVISKNETEMKVKLWNGSIFQVIGTDNIDAIMGTNPVGCVFSEYSLQDPVAWDYVRPILSENDGWAVFPYTPRGMNHGYELYMMAKNNPAWFCQLLTVNETGYPLEKVAEERKAGMSEDMIAQEFMCSFTAAIPGAYYANEIRKMHEQNRICPVPYQDFALVDTWWDLGVDDSTTIIFTQDIGREIHIIDCYEGRGQGLQHYAAILRDKQQESKWIYGSHNAPHDIMVRELGSGESRLFTARKLGLFFRVAPRVGRKEEGIQAVRNIFPSLWIDNEKCKVLVQALTNYHSEYDTSKRVLGTRPVHDWSSHFCDAVQTLAMGHSFQLEQFETANVYPEYAGDF